MNGKSPYIWFLGAGASLFALAALATKIEGKEKDPLISDEEIKRLGRQRFRKEFDVPPGCETIRIKRKFGDTSQAQAWVLDLISDSEAYIRILLEEANTSDPEQASIYVLGDIFPGCQFPPQSNILEEPDKHIVWGLTRNTIKNTLEGQDDQ